MGDEHTCDICGREDVGISFERCSICRKHFCSTCAIRAYGGRRFCSDACGRSYYFHGEDDDDTQSRRGDEE